MKYLFASLLLMLACSGLFAQNPNELPKPENMATPTAVPAGSQHDNREPEKGPGVVTPQIISNDRNAPPPTPQQGNNGSNNGNAQAPKAVTSGSPQ